MAGSDQQRYEATLKGLVSDHDQMIVEETLREFKELQLWRDTTAAHWEEVAELVLPSSRNTFYYGNFNWPGMKKTDRQVDATGMLALSRFAAICDSLLTPRNMFWHGLEASDPYVQKDRQSKLWFEEVTRIMFKFRYASIANFASQNNNFYTSLGAFGNGGMMIDACDLRFGHGLRYKNVPMGELFFHENHQGLVDGFIRWFRLTPRQIHQKWPKTFPEGLKTGLESMSQYPVDILHRVCFKEDFELGRMDYRGMPYGSYYVCMGTKTLLEEGGYHSFPMAISRYEQTPGEVYGRSPAMMVLPALKTLNAEKSTFLKQGHRAADPVLLTLDDGLTNLSLRPGAVNAGGWSADGKPLVGVLPTGNIQISKEMMQEERSLINDAFLVTLFQILSETPQMTAREVIERTNEKGILLAPTIGRQQSEYLGNMIPREIDLLARIGAIPQMPPALREAAGHYEIVYSSPLAKAMRAQQAAGFMRTLDIAKDIASATGDGSVYDAFDLDVALPAIAEIQSVPESWMADAKSIAMKRQSRAKAQQDQQQIQAMPAQAAMIKAQAVSQKAQSQVPPAVAPPTTAPGVPNAQPPIPMGPNEVQV